MFRFIFFTNFAGNISHSKKDFVQNIILGRFYLLNLKYFDRFFKNPRILIWWNSVQCEPRSMQANN